MNIQKKKEEIVKMFNIIQNELVELDKIKAIKIEEALKLQGEYRLLEEMEKEDKKDVKEEKVVEQPKN